MKRYTLSLFVAACIVAASLVPVPETPFRGVPFYDKWAHFAMYGVLSLTLWRDYLRGRKALRWLRAVGVAVVLPVVISGLMELVQANFTTYRSGDWLDFAANSVGVALATLCVCAYLSLRRRVQGDDACGG